MKARVAVTAFAVAFAACGGVHGPGWKGTPLATVSGALELDKDSGIPATTEIRLALAWFPTFNQGAPLSRPQGIITQDVVYEGSFPLNYRFDILEPPPREAISDWSDPDGLPGGPNGAAVGVLLAYEDRNRNQRLDTIAFDGTPLDRVLGASMNVFGDEGAAIVYFDGTLPNPDDLAKQLSPGFNLVLSEPNPEYQPGPDPDPDVSSVLASVVPMTTPVLIALTADPSLDIYVCDAAWVVPDSETDVLTCGIGDPGGGGGVYGLSAFLESGPNGSAASVSFYHLAGEMADGSVTVNGTPVPPLVPGEPGLYELHDPTGALIVPGAAYQLEARVNGELVASAHVTMPGSFDLTAPATDAQFPRGSEVDVAWTASSGANLGYDVDVISFFGDPLGHAVGVGALSWTSPPVDYEGTATVTVVAQSGARTAFGRVIRSVDIEFVAP